MRRVVLSVIVAGVFAMAGPSLTSPGERAAGEPFALEPPPGFVEESGASVAALTGQGGRVWIREGDESAVPARFFVITSRDRSHVEGTPLRAVAVSLSTALRESGVEWVDARIETRTRSDGALVGLVEGACTKKVETVRGPTSIAYQRLNLVFPTDEGTAIVTAMYGKEAAARWEPIFEAKIGEAKGVAIRRAPPPPWHYVAWAAAGLVLGWLGVGLLDARPRAPSRREGSSTARPPAKRRAGRTEGDTRDTEDDTRDTEGDRGGSDTRAEGDVV